MTYKVILRGRVIGEIDHYESPFTLVVRKNVMHGPWDFHFKSISEAINSVIVGRDCFDEEPFR